MLDKKYFIITAVLVLCFVVLASAENSTTCNVLSGSCTTNTVSINTTAINATGRVGKPIQVALIYAQGCPHCEALNSYLRNLSLKYNIDITYINAVTNQSVAYDYLSYYNVSKSDWGSVPILFLNKTYCVGDTTCEAFLSKNITALSATGNKLPKVGSTTIGKVTALEITGLALVDSINPCAFAVLIFLLSTLFMRDPTKRYKILLGGIAFAMGIFAFYISIGVLLLLGIKSVLAIADLKNIYVYAIFGVFTIILGILNLKDYFNYGSLGFVMEVPRRLRPKMLGTIDKIMLGKIASIPGAFIAGVLVTAFLLPCITGPYFVAGSLLKNLPLSTAVLWLGYYNFLFVLPMFIITALVYLSFTSVEKASQFREKNIKKLHLIAGIMLLAVGILIFLQIFGIF